MRKLIVLVLTLALIALPAVAFAGHKVDATGKANLHPVSQSGIKGKITFVDNGSTLTIEGSATGMDPDEFYFSLIYDNGSVPGGPFACEPSGELAPGFQIVPGNRQNSNVLTDGQMEVGFWDVLPNGNGTLVVIQTEYASLDEFDTISIRAETQPSDFDGFGVVACGEVSTHPAG